MGPWGHSYLLSPYPFIPSHLCGVQIAICTVEMMKNEAPVKACHPQEVAEHHTPKGFPLAAPGDWSGWCTRGQGDIQEIISLGEDLGYHTSRPWEPHGTLIPFCGLTEGEMQICFLLCWVGGDFYYKKYIYHTFYHVNGLLKNPEEISCKANKDII